MNEEGLLEGVGEAVLIGVLGVGGKGKQEDGCGEEDRVSTHFGLDAGWS